jgi:hypothetical protein
MTWLNPVALFGLLAVTVPVLVHLFGRRVARRQRFPSLRLLEMAAPSASTTKRPSDPLLMIVRSLTVALAALAIAQPLWSVDERGVAGSTITRVVIVDTSVSMRRTSAAGARALELARSTGDAMLDSARHGLLIETTRPGANVAAAASWLARQPGFREIVLVSDFQRGALSDGDLAGVPPAIGIWAIRIESAPVALIDTSLGGVQLKVTERETEASWERATRDTGRFPLTALHAAEDEAGVRAAILAARRVTPPVRSGRVIAVVFPGYLLASQLKAQAGPLTAAWQGDLLVALRAHPLLRELRGPSLSSACDGVAAAPVPDATGRTVAEVAAGPPPYDALVFSCVEPGSTGAAALLAALASSLAARSAWSELETDVLPDEMLRQWMRQPTAPGPVGGDRTSPHSRWVWLAVLLLLGVEEWLRRRGRRTVTTSLPRRRANAA